MEIKSNIKPASMVLCSLALAFILSSCSYIANPLNSRVMMRSGTLPVKNFSTSGSLQIAKPVKLSPPIPDNPTPAVGFLGVPSRFGITKLVIDTDSNSFKLINSLTGEIKNGIIRYINSAPKGVFRVSLKQKHPVWYAPDQYFQARNLETPHEFSPERYRKGALGEYAIFLDSGVTLHTSPVFLAEERGIAFRAKDLQNIYETLSFASYVEIR